VSPKPYASDTRQSFGPAKSLNIARQESDITSPIIGAALTATELAVYQKSFFGAAVLDDDWTRD
jgi:hypothetical protein